MVQTAGATPVTLDQGKVAIATTGPKLTSSIAPLFDRAEYFLIVGLGNFKAIPNPNAKDVHGTGIQSAQLIVGEGASAVIVNNISLEAMKALDELRVKIYGGVMGNARQAISWYEAGRLREFSVKSLNPQTDDGKARDTENTENRMKGIKDKIKSGTTGVF